MVAPFVLMGKVDKLYIAKDGGQTANHMVVVPNKLSSKCVYYKYVCDDQHINMNFYICPL